ncbi:MAG: GTPase Era [Bacteroidota bacterium]|nr:GTPase Era [Bacteroidota bacterium]
MFKSGFVNIVGLPNSGKSSLVNAFIGQKLSIVSPKPQTTRQRILSILTTEDYQMIFSDSPGWIKDSHYTMHKLMNQEVARQKIGADVILIVIDISKRELLPDNLLSIVAKAIVPKILVLNKIDLVPKTEILPFIEQAKEQLEYSQIYPVSALNEIGLAELLSGILTVLPEHPAYFDNDESSDRSVRFFIGEFIREQIYFLYQEEIPYSCFVDIESVDGIDEQKELVRIRAKIYVNKKSQVPILIGKHGSLIKELGIRSRARIESFLDQRIFLDLSIKLKKDWRNNEAYLIKTGIVS